MSSLLAATSSINIDLNGLKDPSSSVLIIIALTVLSVAPAVLMLMTAFPRVFIVLSLTRNALGTQTVPPNQVLAGLALIISLFIMAPVMGTIYHEAVVPYEHGQMNATQAIATGEVPLKQWMLKQTRSDDLQLFASFEHQGTEHPDQLPLTTVIPAFVISEFESAFLIGFMIFIPFMIIDLVVSSIMMSMGMYMLPPTLISLPFKILLFVLINGWALMAHALLSSFN